jgi:hypothetical protein
MLFGVLPSMAQMMAGERSLKSACLHQRLYSNSSFISLPSVMYQMAQRLELARYLCQSRQPHVLPRTAQGLTLVTNFQQSRRRHVLPLPHALCQHRHLHFLPLHQLLLPSLATRKDVKRPLGLKLGSRCTRRMLTELEARRWTCWARTHGCLVSVRVNSIKLKGCSPDLLRVPLVVVVKVVVVKVAAVR